MGSVGKAGIRIAIVHIMSRRHRALCFVIPLSFVHCPLSVVRDFTLCEITVNKLRRQFQPDWSETWNVLCIEVTGGPPYIYIYMNIGWRCRTTERAAPDFAMENWRMSNGRGRYHRPKEQLTLPRITRRWEEFVSVDGDLDVQRTSVGVTEGVTMVAHLSSGRRTRLEKCAVVQCPAEEGRMWRVPFFEFVPPTYFSGFW